MDASSLNTNISQLLGAGDAKTSNAIYSQAQNSTVDKKENSELLKLRKACQDFEAIFIRQLLKMMRESGPKSDLFDSSFASEIYKDMFDEQLADEMSNTGRFGFADILYEQTKDRILTQTTDANKSAKAE